MGGCGSFRSPSFTFPFACKLLVCVVSGKRRPTRRECVSFFASEPSLLVKRSFCFPFFALSTFVSNPYLLGRVSPRRDLSPVGLPNLPPSYVQPPAWEKRLLSLSLLSIDTPQERTYISTRLGKLLHDLLHLRQLLARRPPWLSTCRPWAVLGLTRNPRCPRCQPTSSPIHS